jgi:hypothetical protein
MNVILICHEKALWKDSKEVGQTFDGWDKLEHELHLCMQITKQGASRKARVTKTRLLSFPDATNFDWSYDEFAKRYGRDVLEGDVQTMSLASPQQVDRLESLVKLLNTDADTITKWKEKAGVEKFGEMDTQDGSSCWPAGDYDVTLIKVEETTSQKSGNPMEVWTFEAYNDGRKQLIKEYVVIPAATFKIKQMAIALGRKDEFDSGSFHAEDHLGASFIGTLSIEEGDANYDDKNRIAKLKPASSGAAAPQQARKTVAAGGSRPPFDDSAKVFKEEDIPFAWSGRQGQLL